MLYGQNRLRLNRFLSVLIALLLIGCQAYPMLPQEAPTNSANNQALRLLGHIEGSALTVKVQGHYAYVGFSYEMAILDIADPTMPRWVSGVAYPTNALWLNDHYAYLVGRAGFAVLDIADPTQPTIIASLPTQSTSLSVAAAGDHAYFVNVNGLHGINLVDPTELYEESLLELPGGMGRIQIQGNYAYITASDGFHIVSLTQPETPVQVGFIPTTNAVDGLALTARYAYLGVGQQLYTVDITKPTRPATVAVVDVATTLLNLIVAEPYLYATGGYSGLRVFDISNPVNVRKISQSSKHLASDLTVRAPYLYLADYDEGLLILDASKPTALPLVGAFHALGPVYEVKVHGSYAYVSCGWRSSLRLVELADPANFHKAGGSLIEDLVTNFALADHYAYLVIPDYGLLVMDIATPTAPVAIGFLNLPGISAIKTGVGYAYAGDDNGTVWVLNLTDPAKPQKVATYPALGYVGNMAVADGFAYLPDRNDLHLMTLADDGALTLVGRYPLDSYIRQITVVGQIAYVATTKQGLLLLDVSTPTKPVQVGRYTLSDVINDLTVTGDYAFLAVDEAGVYVLDIADPTQIKLVGHYQTPDAALTMTLAGDKLYVADQLAGLLILEFTLPR